MSSSKGWELMADTGRARAVLPSRLAVCRLGCGHRVTLLGPTLRSAYSMAMATGRDWWAAVVDAQHLVQSRTQSSACSRRVANSREAGNIC